jgi:hypothetical protein
MSESEIAAKYDMFIDGDYDNELDSFMESAPENFSVKATTMYDTHRSDVNDSDFGDEVKLAEESAKASKFTETCKKVKADLAAPR